MARSVADAAAILTVIAGRDPLDNFTLTQPAAVPDYSRALVPNGLKGVRLGVPRLFFPDDQNINAAFNATLDIIRGLGATVIDPAEFSDAEELLASNNETTVLDTDFKVGLVWHHRTAKS
jgi:amidase